MSKEAIKKAVRLGSKMKHVYVATADSRGMPHLASAGSISIVSDDRIAVEEWFCPGTMQNVEENPFISVVSWDPESDTGSQIIGEVEKVEETAMMDGFSPSIKAEEQVPQTERKLIVRVKEVLAFSHAPHSDKVK